MQFNALQCNEVRMISGGEPMSSTPPSSVLLQRTVNKEMAGGGRWAVEAVAGFNTCPSLPSLTQLCSDALLERVLPPASWRERGGSAPGLEALCQAEILVQVQRYWLGRLPPTLASRMLKDALAKYDSQQGVSRLLIIYLCLLTHTRAAQLSTPIYLHRWTAGRIQLLETLLETTCLDHCRELSLDMYNFYDGGEGVKEEGQDEIEVVVGRPRLCKQEESLLQDIVSRSGHLRLLRLHTVTTDSLLKLISLSCPHLALLDISFSRAVTDVGIEKVCDGSNALPKGLRSLQLEGTGITSTSILLLLEYLPRLEELESSLMEEFLYSMHQFLSSSLEKACSPSSSSSYRLRSLSLCLRRPCPSSSPSLPSLLPLLFPRLEELSFHSLHPSLLPLLPDLSTLPLLTSLLVGGVPLFNLRPLLLPLGPRLLRLSLLSYGSTTGRIDLSLLAHASPNLTHLSLSGSALVTNANLCSPASPPLFPHLQHLHINCHAHLPRDAWTALMSRCLKLTVLDITHCEQLTDANLATLLDATPQALAELTSLAVRGEHRGHVALTEASINRLKARASGLVLGDTFSWSLQGPEVRIVAGNRGSSRGL